VKRCYVHGRLTKERLAAELEAGYVLTDVVRNGHSGGDVAYFRAGTPEELAFCRAELAKGKAAGIVGG